jgi:hypothetical protein
MQSVASLMSIGKADIGNLDELEEEGEDQNEDHTFCSKISEITTQLSNLPFQKGHLTCSDCVLQLS